jgi:hypothetical protein
MKESEGPDNAKVIRGSAPEKILVSRVCRLLLRVQKERYSPSVTAYGRGLPMSTFSVPVSDTCPNHHVMDGALVTGE